ncbi:MAG: glutamate-cysteine ligase family protein [Gemmatimonadota bacterium]
MSEEGGGKPTTVLPERDQPGLFEAFGVEIEYMIVDRTSLDVGPLCDRLIEAVAGTPESEIERGPIAWSNELTLHVLELKTNGPAATLSGLSGAFHVGVMDANRALSSFGARLLPGGMHPWMDPGTETRLWPHEYTEVYRTFDRIFGCSGHGWANLQSTHLNLPFRGDEEFGRLHAAIRLVLPLIPALAASSPFMDGGRGPALDTRLATYRGNARRVPSVAGHVVPEAMWTREQYERDVLGRIYRDLEEHDPEGLLRYEWVNARGAIARFDRGAIEIRLIDTQECPAADLAVVAAVTEVVRALALGPESERDVTADPDTVQLAAVLDRTIVDGDRAVIEDGPYLRALGLDGGPLTAGDVWRRLVDRHPPADPAGEWSAPLDAILRQGPLARRMLHAVGEDPARREIQALYTDLGGCLEDNTPFLTSR